MFYERFSLALVSLIKASPRPPRTRYAYHNEKQESLFPAVDQIILELMKKVRVISAGEAGKLLKATDFPFRSAKAVADVIVDRVGL